ncbi:hypothetical protein [Bradyrhizobium sp. LVM 105]|uniref:hypothetical protein n=1 Tax=Bradyrhizobium sp. LVM 105 TaxID=2341115 RepID=UPI001FE0EF05|nr:hypothetical protein [Bradyrhizobium sp. LVM 105]
MGSQILPARGQQQPTFPSDQFATEVIRRLDQAVAERRVWNIHGLLVLKNGEQIVERYFEGQDRALAISER